VKNTILDMDGTSNLTLYFDHNQESSINHEFWISAKTGSQQNILGMDFISKVSNKGINFEPLKLWIDNIYKDQFLELKTVNSKSFPYSAYIMPIHIDNINTYHVYKSL